MFSFAFLFKNMFGGKFGSMFKRTALRSGMLITMTLMAALCLELLVQASRFGGGDLASAFPELFVIFRAVSIMTWLEVSGLWIRLAVAPKMDIQAIANSMMNEGTDADRAHGRRVVFIANTILYVLRFVAFMALCEFV